DQWLLMLPNPRSLEARALLRAAGGWVLLSTCDHDGVVSGYRTLKRLVEAAGPQPLPRLVLALLDARDRAEAERAFRKVNGVCLQFLGWEVEKQTAIAYAHDVAEHLLMCCRPV